jgi:biopolymer transport protein ExbD
MLRLQIGALLVTAAAAQTPALRKGVSVQMPVTTHAAVATDADQPDSLVVAVTYSGAAYLEVSKVTLAQLSEEVKLALQGRPGKRIYLKADARTPYSTVAQVLDALRSAGVHAPILLTAQHEATNASYVPPRGLEVLLGPPAPDTVQAPTVKVGRGPAFDAELTRRAQRDRQIVLAGDGQAPFGDIVHAVDVCRAAGATALLAAASK